MDALIAIGYSIQHRRHAILMRRPSRIVQRLRERIARPVCSDFVEYAVFGLLQRIRVSMKSRSASAIVWTVARSTICRRASTPRRVEPIYESIAGWREKTAQARSLADLPAQAIKYVRRLEELIGCSAAVLSTSPEREDTILMQNPFEM